MLYGYKDALSLRDEIDSCPKIEVEIDLVHKYHYLLHHIM